MSVPYAIIKYYASLARSLTAEEVREAISFKGRTVVRRELDAYLATKCVFLPAASSVG